MENVYLIFENDNYDGDCDDSFNDDNNYYDNDDHSYDDDNCDDNAYLLWCDIYLTVH